MDTKFRTEIDIRRGEMTVSHADAGLLVGSCFSENMGAKLRRAGFRVASNPFGILFNPASILLMFEALEAGRVYTPRDIVQASGGWFSYDHHGALARRSVEDALEGVNAAVMEGARALKAADYVVVTFGTAWVYELVETGRVVANCHKQPARLFRRRRMTAREIVDGYGRLLGGVLKGKRVVFTVSPVRHLKDGFEENSLSKATLRMAIAQLVENNDNAHYFPAFEIMNDDLRDYRFYDRDMVHPSPVAVGYIWEQFMRFAMDGVTQERVRRVEGIAAAAEHRPLDPQSEEYRAFVDKIRVEAQTLRREIPGVVLPEI